MAGGSRAALHITLVGEVLGPPGVSGGSAPRRRPGAEGFRQKAGHGGAASLSVANGGAADSSDDPDLEGLLSGGAT